MPRIDSARRILVSFCFAAGAVSAAFAATEPRVIPLWPEGVPDVRADAAPEKDDNGRYSGIHFPSLTLFAPAPEKASNTAVIYSPGGGYIRVAAGPGGGEVVRWLNSLGISVFMLKYRNVEYGHPAPLRDVLRAVRIVRSGAAEFGIDPKHIGVLGGSAGAHLSACAGTLFDAPEGKTGATLDAVSARPDFMVLIFPVITMQQPYVHMASRRALLGENPSDELIKRLSVELQVTKESTPAFIVHSQEDHTAVVDNSLLFYTALCHAGVPAELHLFAKGPHGSGMDPKLGPTSEWPKRCETWMRFNGWLPAAP